MSDCIDSENSELTPLSFTEAAQMFTNAAAGLREQAYTVDQIASVMRCFETSPPASEDIHMLIMETVQMSYNLLSIIVSLQIDEPAARVVIRVAATELPAALREYCDYPSMRDDTRFSQSLTRMLGELSESEKQLFPELAEQAAECEDSITVIVAADTDCAAPVNPA